MSRLLSPRVAVLSACHALLLAACAADTSLAGLDPEDFGPDQELALSTSALAKGTLRLNDVYYVPKREGLSEAPMYSTATSNNVVRRVPEQAAVKIVIAEPSQDRYRVDHAGALGWMRASDLTLRHRYNSALSATRINALARARAAMGFSYWWSNARWPTTGPTTWPTNNRGACSGVCGGDPACIHAATAGNPEYGADCSGFVSTIWGFPDLDPNTNPTNNGFATKAYNKDTANWKTVSLASAQPGDAVVIYSAEKKHIFLVSTARNKDGKFTTYECNGCSKGCRTLRRTIVDGSDWHAIRRTGW